MKIDAHQHFWCYNAARDGWIDGSMAQLQCDFLPADLKPLLDKNELDGCVAVQVGESFEENDFLLSLAAEHGWIKKVVGWLDLRSDKVGDELQRLSGNNRLAGFRQIIQHLEPEVLDDTYFRAGLRQLQTGDYSFDLLIYPQHLPAACRLVRNFPQQRFVIDHLAKPRIKQAELTDWGRDIKSIAQFDNVFCKLSGMITEADWNYWNYEQLQPYLDLVFESFGSERLMYGSDWPVALLAGSYDAAHAVVRRYLAACSTEESLRVMGGTACDFYRIAR